LLGVQAKWSIREGLGLFAAGKYGSTGPFAADNSAALKGLFYGGGTTLLTAQLIGSAIITTATFAVALVLMYAVNALGVLRVSEEGELEGLDLHEHGVPAYPEYALHAAAMPHGAADFTARALPSERPSFAGAAMLSSAAVGGQKR